MIALNTSPPPPTPANSTTNSNNAQPGDYHIIPINKVQQFQILALAPLENQSFPSANPSIHQLDIKALKRREEQAVKKMQEKEMRRGKGVSKEGQAVFDALSKTMPCTWDGSSIVVAEVVVIDKPYRTEDCKAIRQEDEEKALPRIRRTVRSVLCNMPMVYAQRS